jgi:hypothetical protein
MIRLAIPIHIVALELEPYNTLKNSLLNWNASKEEEEDCSRWDPRSYWSVHAI